MAFLLCKNDLSDIPAFEYLPCDDITVNVGTALCLKSGHLTVASGTVVPEYLSMVSTTVNTDGDRIPVIRILPTMTFETTLAAANTAIAVGDKYTVDTNGEAITATATGGVATVCDFDGTAAGDKVRVRFA